MSHDKQRWRTKFNTWVVLREIARELRTSPTPEEDLLWEQLPNRKLDGMRFRRQHAIDRFIVDFYCSKASLVVEVDGPIHQYTAEQDAVRQEFLEKLGLTVLRIANADAREEMNKVVARIRRAVEDRRSSLRQTETGG